jgi:hypothetical protein
MASFRMSRASVRLLKKVTCLTLAVFMLPMGAPIQNLFAQEGGVSAPGEPVAPTQYSQEQCAGMNSNLANLKAHRQPVDDAVARAEQAYKNAEGEVSGADAETQHALFEGMREAMKEAAKSILSEASGEEAVADLAAPEAIVGKTLADIGTESYEGYLSERDLSVALRNVQALADAANRITKITDNLEDEISAHCNTQTSQNQQQQTPPSSSVPYIPPPPSVISSTSASNGAGASSGGSSAVPWIIGGVVVVGVVAGVAYASGAFNGGSSSSSSGTGSAPTFCHNGGPNCGMPCSPPGSDCPGLGGGLCLDCNTPFACSPPAACGGAIRKPLRPNRERLTLEEIEDIKMSLKEHSFERFLKDESLRAIGTEHPFASGYGAGIAHHVSRGHRAGSRRFGGNAYSISSISSMPGVGLQGVSGAALGGNGFNGSSLPGTGGQNRTGETASGVFNSSIASAYVPSWSQSIDDDWTINGTASPSWSGVEPTLTIERKLGSGGRLYGEYSENYSYQALGGQIVGGGAECRLTDRQELNFDTGVGVNGNSSTSYVRFGYTFDLDRLP